MDDPVQEAQFYEAYGRAIAKWADFEMCLAYLFGRVTNMHGTVAARVFFSVKTSRARLDMLAKGLPAQAGHPDTVDLIKAIIKRAGGYSDVRNRLAHEYTTLRTDYSQYSGDYSQIKAEHVLISH